MISSRAEKVVNYPNFLLKWDSLAKKNLYDPKRNANGIINLGMAENRLCEDIINQKLSKCVSLKVSTSTHYYFCNYGNQRETIATFLNNNFNPASQIQADNIIVLNGTTALFDILAFALAENGDYFLCPAPYYSRIRNNLADKGGVLCYDVHTQQEQKERKKNKGDSGVVSEIKNAYYKAKSEGLTVKGIVIINPDNPTGKGFTREELTDILWICERYNLHLICDEIYALSVYEPNKFCSILSIKNPPGQDKIHFMWGLSKDYGLSGYRCGVLHTHNKAVLAYCQKVAFYHNLPGFLQDTLEQMLSDREWFSKLYLPIYRRRLGAAYNTVVSRLQKLGISIYRGIGGIFIWANMTKFMKDNTFEEETALFHKLFNGGVYCCPGREFYSTEPGWFRIVFTTYTAHLEEALNRLERILTLQEEENSLYCKQQRQFSPKGHDIVSPENEKCHLVFYKFNDRLKTSLDKVKEDMESKFHIIKSKEEDDKDKEVISTHL